MEIIHRVVKVQRGRCLAGGGNLWALDRPNSVASANYWVPVGLIGTQFLS